MAWGILNFIENSAFTLKNMAVTILAGNAVRSVQCDGTVFAVMSNSDNVNMSIRHKDDVLELLYKSQF